ncbi:ABC transporter substrate-binding protein [Bradyrhizobium forestalis]|uniref:ABC transporter substrate-binding protein n=1 Tax=Bradyrhizobium forestalis TaxID=1419263 RepID=A0A2M8R3W7_9BRAD|nr:ABC transporter substrate-binding protein [Bradyrhizobium forestalis]PJG52515.1 ABC transporter substrate-binding protein [Bradyrhizobium forestalis]
MKRRKMIALVVCTAVMSMLLPLPAEAQRAPYRIGYLALLPNEDATVGAPFFQRLQELGYNAGKTIIVDYRSAEGYAQRLPQLASEMVSATPDVIIAGFGTLAPKAAIAATTSIPIVFTSVGDPVGAGLVASLNQPGANVTGLSAQAKDITAKRLELLEELVPGKKLVAVLANPDTPYTVLALRELKSAASALNQPMTVFEARVVDQVAAAIDGASRSGAASIIILEDPVFLGAKRAIVELLAKARLPAIYGPRAYSEVGGLISYGPDQRQIYRRAAEYVDKILKGAAPAGLPVEQPTKFELVLNLRAAKELGIDVPPTLIARADEVIE